MVVRKVVVGGGGCKGDIEAWPIQAISENGEGINLKKETIPIIEPDIFVFITHPCLYFTREKGYNFDITTNTTFPYAPAQQQQKKRPLSSIIIINAQYTVKHLRSSPLRCRKETSLVDL